MNVHISSATFATVTSTVPPRSGLIVAAMRASWVFLGLQRKYTRRLFSLRSLSDPF